MVELPSQKANVPLMLGVGFAFTVVVADALAEHPSLFVTVTVKVPAVLTNIVCVVAPLDQL